MRLAAFLALLLSCLPRVSAEEAEPLQWVTPLTPISASEADETLVLLVISDDRAYGDAAAWCQRPIQQACQQLFQRRPSLREKLRLQWLRAGLPSSLTGGEERSVSGRSLVAVADGHYRLLDLLIGVPDVDQLHSLIEDSEQTLSLLQRNSRQPVADVRLSIASRSASRLHRRWNELLNEMLDRLVLADPSKASLQEDLDELNSRLEDWLWTLAEYFEPMYRTDVAMRFGLSDASDQIRLVVLEQHIETRRPWCESMIPFLVGLDLRRVWRPLTELVWKLPAVMKAEADDELLSWWDARQSDQVSVLELQPSLLAARQSWPPPQVVHSDERRDQVWKKLNEEIASRPQRTVTAEQLAALIKARELRPVDILRPSRARYLLFEAKRRQAVAIREQEHPARSLAKLRRNAK